MLKAAAAGTVAATAGAASSGTVAADDDGYGDFRDDLPDPSPRHAITGPIEVTYAIVSGFRDAGIAEEDVEEMSEHNYHTRAYQTVSTNKASIDSTFDQLENFIDSGDPTSSPLAEMAYSSLRTTALQALQDGKSVSEARVEGENAAMDELSVSATNILNQYNDYFADIIQFFGPYAEEDLAESLADVEHESGDVYQETEEPIDIVDDPEGFPDLFDWFSTDADISAAINAIEIGHEEYILPNGDTHPHYRLHIDGSGGETGWYSYDENQSTAVGNSIHWDVSDPDGNSVRVFASPLDFDNLLDAIDEIRSDIANEAGDAIEEIMEAHSAGDVDDMDVLSSFDLMREYGDSGDMTRYTSELLAAGLDAQEDVSQQVTIDHPDTGERTGRLFLSWNWDELADWEYEYDADDLVLEVAEESIDDAPELVAVFEDSEATLGPDDLDDGTHQFDEDHGDLDTVERESEGQLWSHIPVDETTDHWESAYFVHEGGDGGNLVNLDPDEPLEIVAVEDDGEELDVLQLDGWNNQTRDPALALDEAARTQEQYQVVSDLEPAHGGGGGGGTDSRTLLLGGGIIALVGMIMAVLTGEE